MKYLEEHDAPFEGKSRSQKKRESTAMQKRGEELAALPPAVRKTLPLSPDLIEALNEYAAMRTHEARRRHMQYIGRLMRELDDPAALVEALDGISAQRSARSQDFHGVERLRDELLDDSENVRATALVRTLERFPALDSSRIQHLIDAALADRAKKRPPKHSRELFRLLVSVSEST